jgi:2-polyprenyl-6-methoxyphenol hydroxylase-like FAD-dependent oxidoreductase
MTIPLPCPLPRAPDDRAAFSIADSRFPTVGGKYPSAARRPLGILAEAKPGLTPQIRLAHDVVSGEKARSGAMYDAIVVGARCAGSPTSMLLARRGYRVLLVDRATFPSDTISTHLLWPHGVAALSRWGLSGALEATGAPPICRPMSFDVGPFALRGTIAANDGRGGFCPRRTVLDNLLLQAAVASGVEFREAFTVENLVFDGDTVVGVRGRHRSGAIAEERARLVIGADGVHSLVAKLVRAPEYDRRPVGACAYYSYFSDVEQDDVELYVRDHCAVGGAPTNDGLHLVMVNWPTAEFPAVRADIDGHVQRALALAPDFADRVNSGKREETWYGTAGVPNYFRKPYGKGWVLVGDASYCRDPLTAQGMSDAFIDAEQVADAIDAGLSGRRDLDAALAAAEAARNDRVRPMYELTNQLATLEPPPAPMQELFAALHTNQEATNAFLSAITGAESVGSFMSPENLRRVVGAAAAAT